MKKILRITLFMLFIAACHTAGAQKAGIKTNLVYDATATINAGIELPIAKKWTLDISGNFNAWKFGKIKTNNPSADQDGARRRWKHWMLQPELRYWLCERYTGHFFGFHALGGEYNVGGTGPFTSIKNHRYQGWAAGAGLGYGHSWILNLHWNIEAELALGYIYTRRDKFRCAGCGRKTEHNRSKNYFGPTKAALNLVYTF